MNNRAVIFDVSSSSFVCVVSNIMFNVSSSSNVCVVSNESCFGLTSTSAYNRVSILVRRIKVILFGEDNGSSFTLRLKYPEGNECI
mmetsp:Transcript_28437/g.42184  ORF Transcript_28437/g.42184 Transcript_28437/m.42184 type:complete len:86 (-) Transcript_28437:180-437(-)